MNTWARVTKVRVRRRKVACTNNYPPLAYWYALAAYLHRW